MKTYESDLRSSRPQPTDWATYLACLLPKWEALLDSKPEETAVQEFLEAHPVLLPGGLGDVGPGGHHGPELYGVFGNLP
jgi:hypothetical protein